MVCLLGFEELKERAEEIKSALGEEKTITVRREHIIEDLTDTYANNRMLIHHRLNVQIDGEPAIDAEGVKREVFTVFFKSLLMKFFVGNSEMVPQLDPRILFTGFYETVGRIISHAFVLVGMFPVGISKAAWHLILTGTVSTDNIMRSFLEHITEREKRVVKKVIDGERLNDIEALSFLSVLSYHGCKSSPSAQDRLHTLENVAATSLLCKPLFCYGRMHAGMYCYPLLWIGVPGSVVNDIYNQMKPCADSVVNTIHYQFTDLEEDISFSQFRDIRAAEEQIKIYLERYIETLSDKQLAALLKFWTGSELMLLPSLLVSFNATQEIARRPIANACVGQLNLSRFYSSQDEFDDEMNLYLGSLEASEFDSY